MEHFFKKSVNPLNIATIFLFLFILSLFFPIRYVFPSNFSLITGIYSDFTSFSLYLSDIFLVFTFIFVLIDSAKLWIFHVKKLKWLVLWLILAFIVSFNANHKETIYYLLKFLELVVAYGTIATILSKKPIKTALLTFFVCLSAFQSLIALLQFYLQHPIGLFKLGEQQVYPWQQGIAKIILNGQAYVRGYGTFFHPNPLAAFLLAGIFFNLYLFAIAKKRFAQILLSLTLLINILGMAVTFSRAAFLALAVGLVIYFGFLMMKKIELKKTYQSLGLVILGLLIALFCFKSFLLTRATVTDSASLDRITYDKIGLRIIVSHPLFGVGLGESVPLMNQYSPIKLLPWDIQPIHNYFLLAAAELGIPGALILIWIFLSHLIKITKHELATNYLLLTTSLVCILILMMFDHYFYTLQQTQMLLWLILGLIAAEIFPNKYDQSPKSQSD